MMSAQQYRARADALIRSSHTVADFGLVLELESTATEWRKLAIVADVQAALQSALAAMGG
jgi:hypothetical protein